MRFDTPVLFQRITEGAYNAENGDYGDDSVESVKVYADVTDAGVEDPPGAEVHKIPADGGSVGDRTGGFSADVESGCFGRSLVFIGDLLPLQIIAADEAFPGPRTEPGTTRPPGPGYSTPGP